MITVLAGGVGAARLLRGLVRVVDPAEVVVVANTGDDLVLHGLHVSPDLDTITYTLAGAGNPETGWGLAGETWQAMDSLDHYGGPTWFRLGDRDLGTHLFRTGRLADGAGLAEVTAEVAEAWGLGFRLLPATEDRLRTMVTLADGDEVGFQEYFVGLRHDVPVSGIRFDGADDALPGPGVLEAITTAEAVVSHLRTPWSPSPRSSPFPVSGMRWLHGASRQWRSPRSSAARHSRVRPTGCSRRWGTSRRSSGSPASTVTSWPPS